VMKPDSGDYFLRSVAQGVEDYYAGRGEAPGRWLGIHADDLGLTGVVEPDDLLQILDGHDPMSGDRITRTRQREVPGFDLTFCAPKSVSIVWALGDAEARRAAREAHEAAVDAALAYVERHACWSRRGRNGIEQVRGGGFIGAAFRHRTSRAGDPHLHTHVLVANATRSDDGWGALDGRHLFFHAKTGGYLYQAQLRAELTRRLGVRWTPVRHGCAEIQGIPPEVLRRFATRADEIRREMARRGTSSARAAQYAVLATRKAKDYDVDAATFHSKWMEQTEAIGFPAHAVSMVLGHADAPEVSRKRADAIRDLLLGPDGLTKRASTFDRRDVLRACCEQFREGADVSAIERLADAILADAEVVPLRSAECGPTRSFRRRTTGRAMKAPMAGSRCSTQELLALETRLVERAAADTEARVGIVADDIVFAVLTARSGLAREQVEMVASLTTSGRRVDVVIAPAGAGKTFALDAARDAWQRSGYRVIGAALSARAAAELESTAGIPSDTIARLLLDLDDPGHGGLAENTVFIVDEAGMVGTRLLARVLDHADHAGAKVVLVGDPRQLPEIDAGGLLRGLSRRIEPIRLVENRRQREAWEREALKELRGGRVEEAIEAYNTHGRIHTWKTAVAARDAMAADWRAATLAGERVLMLASRWSDVDDLNARARLHCLSDDLLSGPTLIIDERPYQAGDRIMTLRNNRRLGARNGTCATVGQVDLATRSIRVITDSGASIVLPSEYLDAGHVRHAYATTIHKAQGQTVDRALVLGSDTLYQEAGYVALSRGRNENRIYLVASEPRPEAHGADLAPPDALDTFRRTLAVSHAKELAVDVGIDRDALRRSLDELIRERNRLRDIERACPPSREYEIAALHERREEVAAQNVAAHQELERIESSRRFGKRAARRLALTTETAGLDLRLARFDEALERLQREEETCVRFLAEQKDLDRLPTIERAIEARLDQLVDADLRDPPAYLGSLGPAPLDETRVARWRGSARYIERHRAERGITDPQRPLGPRSRPTLDRSIELDGPAPPE